jgi:hypothetical protein
MKWVVLAIGICAIAFGSWWGWVGWSIVQVERGWTAVIAGSVLASAGLILLGLFSAIMRVDALNKSVQRLAAGNADRLADVAKSDRPKQHAPAIASLDVPAPPPVSSPPPPPSYAERPSVPPPPPSSLPRATFEGAAVAGTAAVATVAAVAATSAKAPDGGDAAGLESRDSSIANDTHAAVAAALFEEDGSGLGAPDTAAKEAAAKVDTDFTPAVPAAPVTASPETVPPDDAIVAAETPKTAEVDEAYAPDDIAIAVPPRRALPDFSDWPEPPGATAGSAIPEQASAESASEIADVATTGLAAGGALAATVAAVHASAGKPSTGDTSAVGTETEGALDLDISQAKAEAEADMDGWGGRPEAASTADSEAIEAEKPEGEAEGKLQSEDASPEEDFDDAAWLAELFEDELADVDVPSDEPVIAAAPAAQTADHPVRASELTGVLNETDREIQSDEERGQPAPDLPEQPVDVQPAAYEESRAETGESQEQLSDTGEAPLVETEEPHVAPLARIPGPSHKPHEAVDDGSQPESPEAAVEQTVVEQARPADDAGGNDGQPATEPPREKPPLLRSYESQGITYYLYTDGSIEAQTPGGLLHFSSLQELRSFIEKRN